MIVQFPIVENILGGDGNAGRNDFVFGRPGRLNRDVLDAPSEFKLLGLIGSVC